MLARILFIIIISYVFVVAFVYFTQRSMQYFPDNEYPGTPKQNGVPLMHEVKLTAEDGQNLYAWFREPRLKTGKIFVIFHGNAGSMSGRADKAMDLIKLGHGVFLSEYRGYGGIEGEITEQGLYNDGRAAVKWLEDNDYNISQMVFYGESIGSGVAVQMARDFGAKYIVLEGAFSSAVDVGKKTYPYLPVDLLLKDRYDNMTKIKDVKASLLMIHGANDWVISKKHAKKLFEAANHPKDYVEFDKGGHVDLFDYGAAKVIDNWVKQQDAKTK